MDTGGSLVPILVSVIIPPAALLWYLLYSRFRTREPWQAILESCFFGILAVLIALPLEINLIPDNIRLSSTIQVDWLVAARASFMVALIEESAKFLPLALFIGRRNYFRGPADGVIYFALVGLIFGTIENIVYIAKFGASVGPTRALILAFFHAATSAVVGYFYGLAKANKSGLGTTLVVLALVVVLHTAYDTGLLIGTPLSTLMSLVISIGFNIALFFLYIKARKYRLPRRI